MISYFAGDANNAEQLNCGARIETVEFHPIKAGFPVKVLGTATEKKNISNEREGVSRAKNNCVFTLKNIIEPPAYTYTRMRIMHTYTAHTHTYTHKQSRVKQHACRLADAL